MRKLNIFLSVLIISSMFSTILLTSSTASTEYIQISIKEIKTPIINDYTFGDWQNELFNQVLREIDYDDPYSYFYDAYNALKLSFSLYNKALMEGMIRILLPGVLDEYEIVHNGSISYLSASDTNYLSFLPDIIAIFYQGKQLIENLDEYTPISFNETLEYGFNTFFIRDVNDTVSISNFTKIDKLDFVLKDMLQFLRLHPYCTEIQNLIANELLYELNSSNYETDWIYAARTSIAAIKAGTELNNNNLTSEGYAKLNQLYDKNYYLNDNDSVGYKLVIAKYLLNYNISYAEDIVNYVISLLFHTPYGLEPIVATANLIHKIFEDVTFIGVFELNYLDVLPKLAAKLNNSTYLDIFKEILRYWLSNMYYYKATNTYLDAFITEYNVNSFDNIDTYFTTMLFSLESKLTYLLSFINASDTIVDRTPPKSQVSYWIGKKAKFTIDDDQYKNINNVANITPVENQELFLRIKLSDNYGIGLKSSKIYTNDTVTTPIISIYRGTDWLYLEFIHSALTIKNETDTFDYFINLPFNNLNIEKTYRIEAIDKYENKVSVEIKITPLEDITTSTTGIPLTYLVSLIIAPIILNFIYRNRKPKL
ncbi:MAG: hypothetical protein ACTSYD_08745 [Candidatus Heimdallarchaeaceae archaeon]